MQSQCDNIPQTTGGNIQNKCSKHVKEVTKNITTHPSVQHKEYCINSDHGYWLLRYKHEKDKEILGMNITVNTIDPCTNILDCMTTEEIRPVTTDYKHVSRLSECILHGWPSMKAEIWKDL